MTRDGEHGHGPDPEELLDFLEGRLGPAGRARVLDALDADPDLAADLRSAARGLEAATMLRDDAALDVAPRTMRRRGGGPRISPWWTLAAALATLAVSIPTTWTVARATTAPPGAASGPPGSSLATGMPAPTSAAHFARPSAPEPSFVLVLQGRWPDAGDVEPDEAQRRAAQYWGWTAELAERGILIAAGDLTWEPGSRIEGGSGSSGPRDPDYLGTPEFIVGMFALRVDSYEEALAIAAECPHVEFGGSVSVRRVGGGFVTTDGMDDWAS